MLADTTGDSFISIIDAVNKNILQVFLDEFAKTLTEKVICVMENAGWHKGIKIPELREIVYFPVYSPELNPVERLWKYLKEHALKNKVYNSIEDLKCSISEFICATKKETIKSICACNYI